MNKSASLKYREVLEYILVNQKATVQELSSIFFLSESTVRRVLSELEKENFIERFHGGAVVKGADIKSEALNKRKNYMTRQKAAIALKAVSFIKDGMTVIMLGGTTVHAMCQYLKGRHLTVITTSIPVANDLMLEPNMKIILLGGIINPQEYEVRGAMTKASLERLRADLVFVGATNIHEQHGLMTDDPDAVDTYRACLESADRKLLLADSTKFRPGGAAVVARLDELDDIITDYQISEATIQKLKLANINIHIASK
ncbi:MAG TPA: DeoR/GlpR transcriptional regulator [Clostridiales bacterium]|nr:DeoR/GlpR transcriptional regulator [Clostridiales bacterium]